MKKLIYTITVFAITFAIFYTVPEETFYFGYERQISKLDLPPIPEIDEQYALRELKCLGEKINQAQASGHYPISLAYQIDERLRLIYFGSDFPRISRRYGILSFGDEAEYATAPMWKVWGLEYQSRLLREKLSGSAQEIAEYEGLKQKTKYRNRLWYPDLKKVPTDRTLYNTTYKWLYASLFVSCVIAFTAFRRADWVFRRLFSKRTLQTACYFITLCLSAIAQPAIAQMVIGKLKKKSRHEKEEVVDPQRQASGPDPHGGNRKNFLQLGVFGDFTHDRQQFVALDIPVTGKTAVSLFNQNRQAVNGGPKLSLFAAGISNKIGSLVKITGLFGPQYSPDKKQVDQVTVFGNVAMNTKGMQLTVINRLSWGVDGKTPFADRHVAILHTRPMPSWLAIESEIRRSQGEVGENFLGPVLKVGQVFSASKLKKLLGGFYLYPHYDFVRHNWDVRFGLTYSFAW